MCAWMITSLLGGSICSTVSNCSGRWLRSSIRPKPGCFSRTRFASGTASLVGPTSDFLSIVRSNVSSAKELMPFDSAYEISSSSDLASASYACWRLASPGSGPESIATRVAPTSAAMSMPSLILATAAWRVDSSSELGSSLFASSIGWQPKPTCMFAERTTSRTSRRTAASLIGPSSIAPKKGSSAITRTVSGIGPEPPIVWGNAMKWTMPTVIQSWGLPCMWVTLTPWSPLPFRERGNWYPARDCLPRTPRRGQRPFQPLTGSDGLLHVGGLKLADGVDGRAHRGVGVALDDDVHDRRLAARQRALEGGLDLVGVGHALTPAAERLR